jgi:hypothetical protein
MKRPAFPLLFLTAVLLCPGGGDFAQTPVPEADTQNWNEIQLTIPVSKKVDFLIQGTLRIGGNISKAVDERWGFGFNYKLNKYVTINELYYHREARAPNGRHEVEERLTLGATLSKPIGKFTLSDRNSVERRWRQPQVDAWRYRNRIQLEHPFTIRKRKFTGFVSDEVFYDWSVDDWVRNRLQIGARHSFNKHFTGDLYYLRQNDGRSRPGDIHVIGTIMRFRL